MSLPPPDYYSGTGPLCGSQSFRKERKKKKRTIVLFHDSELQACSTMPLPSPCHRVQVPVEINEEPYSRVNCTNVLKTHISKSKLPIDQTVNTCFSENTNHDRN